MTEVTVGGRRYRIDARCESSQWCARAIRVDTGDPFGVEATGASEQAAIERLVAWLTWQHDHASALDALQAAERAYHKVIADSAFSGTGDRTQNGGTRQAALQQVDAARQRLDAVRDRQPRWRAEATNF